MALSDADIFKAKLHHYAKDEKDQFVEEWKLLNNHEWLFRILMHINRSKDGDYSKEIALRTYFTSKNRLADWRSVMDDLAMIDEMENYWSATLDIDNYWYILEETYPNYYWRLPLHVFFHKYATLSESKYSLDKNHLEEFTILIKEIVKYFFIKGVVYNSVNAVKDTVFRMCVTIEKEEDYLEDLRKDVRNGNDLDEFERRLHHKQYGKYLRGLVLLSSYLHPKQDSTDFDLATRSLQRGLQIEHILPRKWNNYDGWTEDTWREHIDTLENLIPLERRLNISAKNEYFDRKKEYYEQSLISDAKDLLSIKEWLPSEVERTNKEKEKRLLSFFKNKD